MNIQSDSFLDGRSNKWKSGDVFETSYDRNEINFGILHLPLFSTARSSGPRVAFLSSFCFRNTEAQNRYSISGSRLVLSLLRAFRPYYFYIGFSNQISCPRRIWPKQAL